LRLQTRALFPVGSYIGVEGIARKEGFSGFYGAIGRDAYLETAGGIQKGAASVALVAEGPPVPYSSKNPGGWGSGIARIALFPSLPAMAGAGSQRLRCFSSVARQSPPPTLLKQSMKVELSLVPHADTFVSKGCTRTASLRSKVELYEIVIVFPPTEHPAMVGPVKGPEPSPN